MNTATNQNDRNGEETNKVEQPSMSNDTSLHANDLHMPITVPDEKEEARSELMSALIPDLPLLMYGSGDVEPAAVSQSTTTYLAELTANYIQKLVAAAVDAHDILTGETGEGILPPVPPTKTKDHDFNSKKRSRSTQPSVWDTNEDLLSKNKAFSETNNSKNWNNASGIGAYSNNRYTSNSPLKSNKYIVSKASNYHTKPANQQHPTDWTGLQGADFYAKHRYDAKVKRPQSGLFIQTRSFLFPICHDKELYGKVKDIQSKRRQMLPELVDPVLLDMMKEECQNNERDGEANRSGAGSNEANATGATGSNGSSSGPNSAASRNSKKYLVAKGVDGVQPSWPGSENILPVHLGEVD